MLYETTWYDKNFADGVYSRIQNVVNGSTSAEDLNASAATTAAGNSSWDIETVDSGGNVGQFTSLALDSANRPHISYYDAANGKLKYAWWTGSTWNVKIVDFGADVGRYSSLVLNSSDSPCISYYDAANGKLKYAAWTGSTWSIETVDDGGDVGRYSSLALDSFDRPFISYYNASSGDLKLAAWWGKVWGIQTVASAGNVGEHSSLALDTNNDPHVSYYDATNGNLKYARWTGSTWSIQSVDTGGDVGLCTSLKLDSKNYPHISYYDITNGDLKYAKWTGSTWSSEPVATKGNTGGYTSLALDTSDHPHISYYDATSNTLMYAAWTGSTWSIETVDDGGDVGGYTSLALDSSNYPHISYYDFDNDDLKYATVKPDLIITDFWLENGTICYQLQNIGGTVAAHGHFTGLYLSDPATSAPSLTQRIDIDLAPSERLKHCFTTPWHCSGSADTIYVCADCSGDVVEKNESNNCRAETWKCDVTPPQITAGPTVSALTQTSASISWSTNEASDSVVKFGRYAGTHEEQASNATQTQTHVVALSALAPSTTYHYAVQSADASNNTVRSKEYYFKTPPVPDSIKPNITFFAITGRPGQLPLELTALADDNRGVERVEFYMDGIHIETDHATPFQCHLNPQQWGMSRAEFFTNHIFEALAFDESGLVTSKQLEAELVPSCGPAEMEILNPDDGYTIYTNTTGAPPGTVIEIEVYAAETGWDIQERRLRDLVVPQFIPPQPVERVEIYIDGELVYNSTEQTTNHVLLWIAPDYNSTEQTLTLGNHTIVAYAYPHNDPCIQVDRHTITVALNQPDIQMTRQVDRFGNYFRVRLWIENQGLGTVYLYRITDRLAGFQAIKETGAHTVDPSYSVRDKLCVNEIDFPFSPYALEPGERIWLDSYVIPVLYPGFKDYRLGVGGTEITYTDSIGTEHHETFSLEEGGSSFTRQVDDAIKSADYLLITNPPNLFGLNSADDANELLATMAELAYYRNGTLGYFYSSGSLMTRFDGTDKLTTGDVLPYGRDEIILAEDETDKHQIRMYDATHEWVRKHGDDVVVPFNRTDLHEDDAIAAGNFYSREYDWEFGDPSPEEELLVADGESGRVDVYQNDHNTGGFDRVVRFTTDFAPGDGFAVGDVHEPVGIMGPNLVGEAEAIVAKDDGSITIYTDFDVVDQFTTTFNHGDLFAVGDVRGDSMDDIIIVEVDEDLVSFYDGDGTRRLYGPLGLGVDIDSSDALAVGDVWGDDKEELIIADESDARLYIYGLAGGLSHPISCIGTLAISHFDERDVLTAGDVLGDAKAEIIIARSRNHLNRFKGEVEIIPYYGSEEPGDKRVLNNLITEGGEWATRMNDDWVRNGYLLLVGETEIIPAYSTTKGDRKIRITDYMYANTRGDSDTPELAIGRIIGDNAQRLIKPIRTSIDIERGFYQLNTSTATVVSGYPKCYSGDCDNINLPKERNHVADLLRDKGFGDVEELAMVRSKPAGMDDETFIATRRDAFFNATQGRNLIHLVGHGNYNVWDLIWTNHVDSNFTAGDTVRPFIYAASCLTGKYAAGYSLAEAFLWNNASAYYGATEISISPQDEDFANHFYNRLNVDQALGDVIRHTKRDFWGRQYVSAIYHLYGDPKLYFSAPSEGSFVQGESSLGDLSITGPLSTLTVSIPEYEVTTFDGEDYVEIPGEGMVLEPGKPAVPLYTVEVTYPRGYKVQEVILTNRSGLVTDTGLNIPTVNLAIATNNDVGAQQPEENSEWWPERDFDWAAIQEPGDNTTLVITMYPFFFNRQTTDVRFYQNFSFEIQYTLSEVEIGVETDKIAYEPGEPVTATITLLSTANESQDMILSMTIRSEATDEIADALPLRTLTALQGLASFSEQWNSTGFEPGNYFWEAEIRDNNGTLLDRETQMFVLGRSSGMITNFTVRPENFEIGDEIAIDLTFENTGTMNLTGTAVLLVRNATGSEIMDFRHNVTDLLPAESVWFNDTWNTAEAEEGAYEIIGCVLYESTATEPVSVTVQTAPDVFDTGASAQPYPTLAGTHNGTLTPFWNLTVSNLYTYSCVGTGGHAKSIAFYYNGTLLASGAWEGYVGDWHNITLTPPVTLQAGHVYNYIIVTGSYPQIIHAQSYNATGGVITCAEFVDVNGKRHEGWIPALRLE